MSRSRTYYLLSILLALLLHGSLLLYTVGNTYDAYVHMFFGSHYAESWFETWNYRWYCGFTMTSYPPLVHQIIALLTSFVSLKSAFILWALAAIALFIRGIFHFSKLWVPERIAAYSCILAVLSSSYIEAVHIFGQLPSITGVALLLNACPEIYKWIRFSRWSYFFTGISLIACVTVAHHVTTIFGMVFFIAPVMGTAVLDICIAENGGIQHTRISHFIKKVFKLSPLAILFGITAIIIVVSLIFPYWYWSKTDPISQVSIPHGSRASFIEEPSLGLVFFLIPWGIILFFLPAIFAKIYSKRNLFLGLSFSLLLLLGTGGTTPIPKMILGENAFNILTLDRFTFWGSIMALPFLGQICYNLIHGNIGAKIRSSLGGIGSLGIYIILALLTLGIAVLTINFSNFRSLQPKPIDPIPIKNFMERDGHDKWRYLTLGFGDQMAWVSAHSTSLSVDGNYHSARRLPQLTSRAVERIENSKYLGEEGLAAMRDFISTPEDFNLKYIFCNDKFYEPVLNFYGWKKLRPLENHIDVWERKDIPPLPVILPRKDLPKYQKLMWGIIPLSCLSFAIILNLTFWAIRRKDNLIITFPKFESSTSELKYGFYFIWFCGIAIWTFSMVIDIYFPKNPQENPQELIYRYFHDLDYKRFETIYSYLDKSEELSIEQFMLELSLEDGILASYSKLDSINILDTEYIHDDLIKIEVAAHWFTSIQKYSTNHQLSLTKNNGLWYIKKDPYNLRIPPDQMLKIPDLHYYDQGRRKALAEATFREDVLDRSELYINQANLIRSEENFHIVGELINIDTEPCFVTIEAILYDDEGNEICKNNANEFLIHKLLPKEDTPFRIDFNNWDLLPDSLAKSKVKNFVVLARSMVNDERMYKFIGLKNLNLDQNTIHGELDNYGNREVTVAQVLLAKLKDNEITWVDAHYLDSGVRPQRYKTFEKTSNEDYQIFKRGTDENLLVNGTKRSQYRKLLPQPKINTLTNIRKGELSYKLRTNAMIAL